MERDEHLGLDDVGTAVLVDVSELIANATSTADAIVQTLTLLERRLELGKGRVVLPDLAARRLSIHYAVGLSAKEVLRGTYSPGEGVTGRVMTTGQMALVPDVTREANFLGRVTRTDTSSGATLAYIAVPIIHVDETIGVLAAYRTYTVQREFTGDLLVMRVVAAMIGRLLANAAAPVAGAATTNGRAKTTTPATSDDIVGGSNMLRRCLEKAVRAADSAAAVLLIGESGTGKEKFAQRIHASSPRSGGPFVGINCAAIPAHLLESELFGHEKGSFTGATAARQGRFEAADGGTLFLDEIGDMSLDLQAKLLRVLQEMKVQKLGGNAEIPIDVRVIAATNKNLDDAVRTATFRLDLYYRLNVLPIQLPPLRERKEDIAALAEHFLCNAVQRYGRGLTLSTRALQVLESYAWPGNVRQLQNVIERLVVMSDKPVIDGDDIDAVLAEEGEVGAIYVADAIDNQSGGRPYRRVSHRDREAIVAALREADGNKTLAAMRLKMSTRQLQYRLVKLGICDG